MPFFGPAASLAARQHSTITTDQLRHLGYSPKQIRTIVRQGTLRRVTTGVYVIAGSEPTWHQRLAIATHMGGPVSVVSHRSAAALWRLDGFRPGHVEITSPWPIGRSGTDVHHHRSTELPSRDRTSLDSLAVTTPTRTLIDLGRYLSSRRLGSLVDDAVRRHLTSYEALELRLSELARRGRPGIRTVREVMADRSPGSRAPGSPFEVEVRALLVGAGLPDPVAQHPVDCGEITYVLDLAWPDQSVAVECDGFRFHRTPEQLEWDDRRRNELGLRGWLVHHVTWRQLRRDPQDLVAGVRRALRRVA